MTTGPATGGSAAGAFAAAAAGGSSVGLAPNAPGRLGDVLAADALFGYLGALVRWRDDRRVELDRLDAAALAATEPDSYTGDLVLAMSLWQAITDRCDAIVRLWDSGRADRNDREKISQLVWGRLDSGLGGGLAVTFVEACRLSDAIVSQLRTRLALDPATADTAARLTAVRAQIERCRDLADAAVTRQLDTLRQRADRLAEQVGRGADVAGPVRVLEDESNRLERDLIVAAGRRTNANREREETAGRLARARAEATDLLARLRTREAPLTELAERCRDRIANPPRLGVPRVDALGPLPDDPAAVPEFLARLHRVDQAMTFAEQAYNAPLAERDELRGRLDGYRAMAQARGEGAEPALGEAYQAARTTLWSAPCDLTVARAQVAVYQAMVHGGKKA
jgi:hypothetical protein